MVAKGVFLNCFVKITIHPFLEVFFQFQILIPFTLVIISVAALNIRHSVYDVHDPLGTGDSITQLDQ